MALPAATVSSRLLTIKRAPFNAEDGLVIVALDRRQNCLCEFRDHDVLAGLDVAVQATVGDLIACDLIVHELDNELALQVQCERRTDYALRDIVIENRLKPVREIGLYPCVSYSAKLRKCRITRFQTQQLGALRNPCPEGRCFHTCPDPLYSHHVFFWSC